MTRVAVVTGGTRGIGAAISKGLKTASYKVNAGITQDGMFHKMAPEQWYTVINTNLNSLFNMTRRSGTACASASSAA
jgi:NAD(P)-dependent dehydrogenase (short-subunit alcohol dehydrogenase family)